MGYILPETYKALIKDLDKQLPNIFVETGTFKGGVPLTMLEKNGHLDPFEKVYTIELGYELCKIASRRFQLLEQGPCAGSTLHTDDKDEEFIYNSWQTYFDDRLTLCHGDSAYELESVMQKINEPCCFWLDAHGGATKYASSEEVPLLKELEVIKNHHIKDHIIAIDDAHLFGSEQYDKSGNIVCDYSHVTFDIVKEKILEINPSYDVGLYAPYNMEMIMAF